jgi:hypothetical protein
MKVGAGPVREMQSRNSRLVIREPGQAGILVGLVVLVENPELEFGKARNVSGVAASFGWSWPAAGSWNRHISTSRTRTPRASVRENTGYITGRSLAV